MNNDASSDWQKCLAEAEPCHFPRYGGGVDGEKRALAVDVKLTELSRLRELATGETGDLESVLHTAWALVLHCYTGLDDVCFGYCEIRRDAPSDGSSKTQDGFFSMPIMRLSFEESAQLAELVGLAKEAYSHGIQCQQPTQADGSITEYPPEQRLFNTTISLEKCQHRSKCDRKICPPSAPRIGTSLGVSAAACGISHGANIADSISRGTSAST